ncbi:probable serine/threonine-protein kinase DDB_G0267686 isoform X2 [Prorops nasuta]|uniref:probable serine/threonine-protein kinase DDB_G0267686 isoform X2 n=1 Tax=Prorops nasuta TaxID=863751 RepID=UPI0034CF501E
MDNLSEMTFGEVEIDDRYKKLKRALKLSCLKNEKKDILLGNRSQTVPRAWPSMSSIHPDTHDTDSMRSARGSEVVSASNNFGSVLLKKNDLFIKGNLVTSSVKSFHVRKHDDSIIMPPPKTINIPCSSRKVKTVTGKSSSMSSYKSFLDCNQSNFNSENSDLKNKLSLRKNKTLSCNSSYQEQINNVRKDEPVFKNWRLILNDQFQLIIKGEINSGRIARSKPILRRLSASIVESINKRIYRLEGDIVDNRRELPDYVRGKFVNGFPDDWVNVYQIWRSFVFNGSKPTFRWPTAITDSDDDLQSKITDITLSYKPKRILDSLTYTNEKRSTTALPTNSSEENKDISSTEKMIENQQNLSKSNEVYNSLSKNHNYNLQKSFSSEREGEENRERNKLELHGQKLLNLLVEIQETLTEKLLVLADNLKNNIFSQEYILKILELLEHLHFIMSYTEDLTLAQGIHVARMNDQKEQEKLVVDSGVDYETENSSAKCYSEPRNETPKTSILNDMSESEIYLGVPKVSVELIEKHMVMIRNRHQKRRIKRPKRLRDVKQLAKENQILNDQKINKNKFRKFSNSINNDSNSTLSFTEDDAPEAIRGKTDLQSYVTAAKPISFRSEKVGVDSKYIENILNSRSNNSDNNSKKDPNVAQKTRMYLNEECTMNSNNSAKSSNNSTNSSNNSMNYFSENINLRHEPRTVLSNIITNSNSKETNNPSSCGNTNDDANYKTRHRSSKSKSVEKSINIKYLEYNLDKQKKSKSLIDWLPAVINVSSSPLKFGLIFKGNLLNNSGHIDHGNFSTKIVKQKLSAKKFITVDDDVYTLVGSMKDAKHVIPEVLLVDCKNGCPTKIEHFCKMWKFLEKKAQLLKPETDHDSTINTLDVSVSSRGRRILPPLSYWTDERVILIGDIPHYSPGMSPKFENKSPSLSPKVKANEKDVTVSSKTVKRETTNSFVSSKWLTMNTKRRIINRLQFPSTDSCDNEIRRSNKRRKSNESKKNTETVYKDKQTLRRKLNLKSQQKSELKTTNPKPKSSVSYLTKQESTIMQNSPRELTFKFYEGTMNGDDIFSEDQMSII